MRTREESGEKIMEYKETFDEEINRMRRKKDSFERNPRRTKEDERHGIVRRTKRS